MTARIRAGEGSLGKLLNDESVAASMKSAANLDSFTRPDQSRRGHVGPAGRNRSYANEMSSVSDRLDKVVAALQQGEGTAGQLLRDKQLYENMNGTMAELRDLVAAIRRIPSGI